MKYNIKKLADDLWAIDETFVRCFLFHGERGTLLIDSCASGGEEFWEAVYSITNGIKPELAVTHSDRDHTAGFTKGDEVYVHPAEYYHLVEHEFSTLPMWDNDIFDAGNRQLRVILIPGHTPGSVAFADFEHKKLFIGDSVSSGSVYLFGQGRNIDGYIASLEYLKQQFPDYDYYPCHGDEFLPAERLSEQLECAIKTRSGELVGEETAMPCKLYRYKNASILY